VCCGLAFLHRLNLLHRDIKPDNVMLAGGKDVGNEVAAGIRKIRLNIVDFDMCIFMDENSEASTGHIEGTPGYLAPEVLSTRKYSMMSDLFALGCLMFFVLRKEEPCGGAGFDSLPTGDLVEEVNRWTMDAINFCERIDADEPPATPQLPHQPDEPDSEATSPTGATSAGGTSPASRVSIGTNEMDVRATFKAIPLRLWKLMAWCVQQDPAQRPQSAEEVLRSGLFLEDVGSPMSPDSQSPKDRKKKKDKKSRSSGSQSASISDLLKLGGSGKFEKQISG
jgi:serine/threonine protein kinase